MENFIRSWVIDDLSLCDKIIEYHRNSNRKELGSVYDDTSKQLIQDKSIKDSVDVMLNMDTPLRDIYIDTLTQIVKKYIDVFPYCSWSIPWGVVEKINIQHYLPGGGFYQWHCERSNGQFPATARHLVFMTYLNDVTDQGETEFFHQQIKIKPQKGLTVIWPADWTYTHRGIPSLTQEKFIVTGWLSFLDVIQDQPVKIKL
jgi:prolyl 4-hydroxylase